MDEAEIMGTPKDFEEAQEDLEKSRLGWTGRLAKLLTPPPTPKDGITITNEDYY